MTEILKTWPAGLYTCKLWRETDAAFRGCVFQGGEPLACVDILALHGQEKAEAAVESLVRVLAVPLGARLITNDTPITDAVFVPVRAACPKPEESVQSPIPLAPRLEAVPVNNDVATLIFDACDPPGLHKGFSIDLRRPLYALQRSNPPREPLREWDSDGQLRLLVALSRFVHGTSISFEYAVRVVGSPQSGRFEIIPGPVRDIGARAWTATPNRDWLTPQELAQVGALYRAFTTNPFEERSRLSHAMWFNEYAAQTYYVDLRWTLLVTGLETLLNTDSGQSTRHFTKRVPVLAQLVGSAPISPKEASKMWQLRSALVHGAKHGGLSEENFALYDKMEDLLRRTLRAAVWNEKLRGLFSNRETIDGAFSAAAQ